MRGGNKRNAFLSQPAPEVWLIEDNSSPRVELSTESKGILQEYWIEALKYQLCTKFIPAKANEMAECDARMTQYARKTYNELQKHSVAVDGITRNIYSEESDKIVRYVEDASAVSVGELKKLGLSKKDFESERE